MRRKIRVFVASFEIANRCADKICRYCGPAHNEEIIARELKRFSGAGLLLSNAQKEVLDIAHEFCKEHDLELEVVDMSGLSFFDKMKLVFKGVRAPSIWVESNKIQGMLTKEKLEAISLGNRRASSDPFPACAQQ